MYLFIVAGLIGSVMAVLGWWCGAGTPFFGSGSTLVGVVELLGLGGGVFSLT